MVIHQVITPGVQASRVGLDKCKMCIEFASEALNELLNIILRKFLKSSSLYLLHVCISCWHTDKIPQSEFKDKKVTRS